MTQKYQLAQLNITDAKGKISSEVIQGFVNRLDQIRLLADNVLGFIWHYNEEDE